MHVFITAPSGIGKTTVTNELASRGYAAFDTDYVPGLARLELRETGEPVDWPETDTIDWKKYGWNIQSDVLDEVLAQSETVFLSGICGNQDEFYHRFGKLIVLTLNSPEEYLRRQQTRPRNSSNDSPAAIQRRLGNFQEKIQQFVDAGFIPVDNSGTPVQTADKILQIVHEE